MKAGAPRREPPDPDAMRALLRDAGLRSTVQRLAVLAHFHVHDGQHSHADLAGALGRHRFDRASIYRILIDLAEAQILSRTDLGDHVWRFELRKGADGKGHGEEHPHFVCVDCGKVSCLPGLSIAFAKRPRGLKAPKAVGKRKVAVQLKGLCDDCE